MQVATWSAHSSKVILLLQFGQQILSIDADGHLLIWSASEAASVDSSEPVGELKLRDSFTPTCIMHPDTYLNKVNPLVVGVHFVAFICEVHITFLTLS